MKSDPRRLRLDSYPWCQAMETRFADMDINRHLNNVAFARFFEETRIRFNWSLIEKNAPSERPHYLVAHVAIDFLGEGRYPDPVTMTYAVGSIGRTSFRASMAMFQQDNCIALCDSVLVHRGADGPSPLPEALRNRLEAFSLRG